MKHSDTTFLGLRELDLDSAQAVILPVPYEATTSYGQGTALGPQALLAASNYIELYDEIRDCEPATRSRSSIDPDADIVSNYWTAAPVEWTEPFEPAMAAIYEAAVELVQPGRFLCAIGGEHSITGSLIQAHKLHYPNLHVLQIDAHCDLRNSYEGSIYSHASAMARVIDQVDNRLTQVGIRAACLEDRQTIRERQIQTFWAQSLAGKPASEWIPEVVASVGPQVYLTVDVDGLDPSIVPATGTPEPGGLGWWDTLNLIRTLGANRHIVGADIVELAVTADPEANRRSAFSVAKLTYQILAAALCTRPASSNL